MEGICCIFNYPTHYRKNIYKLMEDELECDFYFGDVLKKKLKMIDFNIFDRPQILCRTKKIGLITWNPGTVKLSFKGRYKIYILTGELSCLSTWFTLIINQVLNKETYIWSHCWHGDEKIIRRLVTKFYLKLASGLLLYGNYAKKMLIQEGFDEKKLHVIYNSLDYDLQLEIRRKLTTNSVYKEYFDNDYPVVIFTGRLTIEKKINQLIDAHEILLKWGVPFNVLILGDGEDTERLKELVVQKDVQSYFWFFGACYDEAVIGNFYYNATVCVSPGNVGLTAIHAMTYGCPVIAHDTFTKQGPEFEAIEPGVTGDFFEKDNVGSLAEIIKKWISLEDNERVKKSCFNVIDSKYNPTYQIEVLKNTVK